MEEGSYRLCLHAQVPLTRQANRDAEEQRLKAIADNLRQEIRSLTSSLQLRFGAMFQPTSSFVSYRSFFSFV